MEDLCFGSDQHLSYIPLGFNPVEDFDFPGRRKFTLKKDAGYVLLICIRRLNSLFRNNMFQATSIKKG